MSHLVVMEFVWKTTHAAAMWDLLGLDAMKQVSFCIEIIFFFGGGGGGGSNFVSAG